MQAMAAAVQNMYGISRHSDGATRVNAGVVEGGTASNIIPEEVRAQVEVRGETTELKDYMSERVRDVVAGAARMHDCEFDVELGGQAPSATSDQALVDFVMDAADGAAGVTSIVERDALGGSEDATFLMQSVQDRGGLACYVGVGTDHPGGHHTATFDVDEDSLTVGVDVLVGAIERVAERRP
jgi:aminobenzoyl-glutamate utilization protein A